MPKPDIELLIGLLARNAALNNKGLTFSLGCGVLVERRGHARGVWRCERDQYSWTPAGYNQPTFWAESAQAAVDHTLAIL